MKGLAEILRRILDSVRRTYSLYKEAAEMAPSDETKALFDSLAGEELEHEQALRNLTSLEAGEAPRAPEGPTAEQALAEMERELTIAATVQANLLPKQIPVVPGLDMAAVSVPARRVGGDYYDLVYKADARELAVVIGDVMGKGFGAALLMANVRAAWRTNYVHGLSTDWTLDAINRALQADFNENTSFVTLFTGVYSVAGRTFSYSNAGHNPTWLIKASEEQVTELGPTGIVVGIEERAAYVSRSVALNAGDVLFLYTDGLLDAWSRDMLQAEAELGRSLLSCRSQNAAGILGEVTKPLRNARGNLTDDASCLVIKVVDSP